MDFGQSLLRIAKQLDGLEVTNAVVDIAGGVPTLAQNYAQMSVYRNREHLWDHREYK